MGVKIEGVPDGYELVRIGQPNDELVIGVLGDVFVARSKAIYPIVRKIEAPKPIEPPEVGDGYRLIDITKDTPQEGDEFWSECESRWLWRPHTIAFDGIRNNRLTFYRRKITPVRPMTRDEFLAAWKARNFCPLIASNGTIETVDCVVPEYADDKQLVFLGNNGWQTFDSLAKNYCFLHGEEPYAPVSIEE